MNMVTRKVNYAIYSLIFILLWIALSWIHFVSEISVNAFTPWHQTWTCSRFRKDTRINNVLSLPATKHDATISEESSTQQQVEKSSKPSCPFSRAYPRYRIDLTPPEKNQNKKKAFFSSFFSWASTAISPKSQLLRSTSTAQTVEWKAGLQKAAVLAYLWRTAANFCSQLLSSSSSSSSSSSEPPKKGSSVLIAFPDASPQVVCQWVDLFRWSQKQPLLTSDDCSGSSSLQISYQDEHDIPAVLFCIQNQKMDREDDNAALQQQQQKQQLDHETITKRTQAWVKRILVEQGICPFTKSVRTSGQGLADVGVPVGRIAYHTSSATHTQICTLQADIWEAVQNMIEVGPVGPKGISSILLAAPHWDEYFGEWSGPVFCLLEAGVLAASIEQEIGVVCFHPYYQIPDGSSWPGFGQMHSQPRLQKWVLEQDPDCLFASKVAAGGAWQRRTPHATVNVLRAEQLAAAEGRRNSAELYYQNIRKLVADPPEGIGLERLQQDLDRERRIGETES